MWILKKLHDPMLVVAFQKLCGIHGLECEHPGQGSPAISEWDSKLATGRAESKQQSQQLPKHTRNGLKNGTPTHNGNGFHLNGLVANGNKKHHNAINGIHKRNGYSNGHMETCDTPSNGNIQHENGFEKQTDYKITNHILYYIFHFGANLGNEIFYITFLPMMMWNFDSLVSRKACAFWALYMYIGQATKDILKIPRPPSPPVIRLEERYALEYGMPSTHAMVGAGLPFSFFILTVNRYQYPWQIGLAVCLLWCALVCFSRIYLGMHTFLDVVAGLAYVFALMPVFFTTCDILDEFAGRHYLGGYVSVLLPLLLCFCYPTLDKWSTARGDTTLILAVAAGMYLGTHLNIQYGYLAPNPVSPPYLLPTSDLLPAVLRFTSGLALLALTREVLKTFSYGFVCWLLNVPKQDLKAQQRLCVELPYKFITYAVIGFNAIFTAPLMFRYLGIERASHQFEY